MLPINKYLTNLTPLRGIAAIWVVVYHFSEIVTKFVSTDRSLILTKGYLMVDLFFIMSGFIIYHVYQGSFQPTIGSKNFSRFLVARFARIYPLHFFTLAVLVFMAIGTGSWNPVQSPASISTNLLLIHSFGIHKIFTWNVPSWSISAEWWAYMVFPLLAVFLSRNKRLAISLMFLFVVFAYIAIMFWIPRVNFFDPGAPPRKNLDVTFDYGFLRGMAGFVMGMLLYQLYQANLFTRIFQKDITAIFLMLLCMLFMHLGVNDGFTVIAFAAIVLAFALNNQGLHRVCQAGVPQYLGKISYSIYLVQIFPLIPVFTGLKLPGIIYKEYSASTSLLIGSGYCLIYLLIVIAVGSLTYYTIEKPCRRLINRKWGKETMPVYA